LSKFKLISAFVLVVLILCLSACSKSQETGATPDATLPQSSVKQSSSVVGGVASSVAGTASADRDVSDAEQSKDDTNRQITGGVDDNDDDQSGQNDNEASPAQNGSDENGSRTSGNSAAGSSNDRGDHKDEEPKSSQPSADEPQRSQDRDNAEVNFNDL